MKLSNQQIYQFATNLFNTLNNFDGYVPAKANFFLQKNLQILTAAAEEIDSSRLKIISHYGVLNIESQQYDIAEEKTEQVFQELNDLFSIDQDLNIKTFSIEDLGNTEFTPAQMQAIMFMIEE